MFVQTGCHIKVRVQTRAYIQEVYLGVWSLETAVGGLGKRKEEMSQAVVANTFNPSTGEVERQVDRARPGCSSCEVSSPGAY